MIIYTNNSNKNELILLINVNINETSIYFFQYVTNKHNLT